jgi:integration host factor subunit beta
MNKGDLIKTMYSKCTHLPEKVVERGVNVFFDVLSECLVEKTPVELRGFGTFSLKKMPSLIKRNPKKGTSVSIPSRNKIVFKLSRLLKKQINP